MLGRLSVSQRFLLVLAIGIIVQAGISIAMIVDLRTELLDARASEARHLDQTAYSIVASYYARSQKGEITETDAQRAAMGMVRNLRYDGNNYFFIWDLNGTSIVHGSVASLEGKNLIHSALAKKLPFVSDMVAKLVAVGRSDAHEGFASYRMTRPGEKKPLPKLAYAKLFAPWGWVIGTGVYVEDIDSAFWAQARRELAIAGFLTLFAASASFFLSRDLTRALQRLARRTEQVAAGELEGEVPATERGDEIGSMARALMVLRDTSGEAVRLKAEQVALEQSNAAKSQFLANMSHELRTPLNAVIGFSDMFMAETFGPLGDRHYKDYARDIHRSGTHLLSLINDVLDLSRLDAGQAVLQEEPCEIDILFDESLRMVAPQAEREGITLSRRFAPGLPSVVINSRRISQVFLNILSNAVKFTPRNGRVEAEITWVEAGLRITVTDTGIEIAKENIPRVFERFGQVDSSHARKYAGTGLGVPLAKELIELHGGTLTIESALNVGTTVTIMLPPERIIRSPLDFVA